MQKKNRTNTRNVRVKAGRAAMLALVVGAAAAFAAPAAGQLSISIGGDHHDRYNHHRPGYRTITGAHGSVVYDRGYVNGHRGAYPAHYQGVRTHSRLGFFSPHGIGTRTYRSPRHYRSNSVLPSHGYSSITPGHVTSRSSRSVYVNTIAHDVYRPNVYTPVVERRVYVQPRIIEKTVIVERDDPYRYGRDDRGYGNQARTLIGDAERAHAAGDWHTAIKLYENSISYRRNVAAARRGLALVYLETDHVNDGLRLLQRAYEAEPTLAVRVFDDRILEGARLSRLLEDAQRTAERQCSARGWLAVAVLRQAAGDREGAKYAIGEAARFGLHRRVVDSWYHALTR